MENIITSYYQITELFKSVLSIQKHAGSKDERKQKQLDGKEIKMTYRLKSEKSAKNFSYTKTYEEEHIFSVPCYT